MRHLKGVSMVYGPKKCPRYTQLTGHAEAHRALIDLAKRVTAARDLVQKAAVKEILRDRKRKRKGKNGLRNLR